MLDARVEHLPHLGIPERHRHGRAYGCAEWTPRVGRQARRDVDGENRRAAGVHCVDDGRVQAFDGGVQTGAEERVDHERRADEVLPQLRQVFPLAAFAHAAAGAAPRRQCPGGVATNGLRRADEPHVEGKSRAFQVPRDDETVPAIVAASTYDDGAATLPVPPDHGGGAFPGTLHEHVPRGSMRDGPLVEGPHLTGRDDQHGQRLRVRRWRRGRPRRCVRRAR